MNPLCAFVGAYVAGVREGDRLIEINDENVQNMEDTDVKQRIRAIKYPDPLVLLVASPETADYYSRTRKVITSDLANPRRGTDSTIGKHTTGNGSPKHAQSSELDLDMRNQSIV